MRAIILWFNRLCDHREQEDSGQKCKRVSSHSRLCGSIVNFLSSPTSSVITHYKGWYSWWYSTPSVIKLYLCDFARRHRDHKIMIWSVGLSVPLRLWLRCSFVVSQLKKRTKKMVFRHFFKYFTQKSLNSKLIKWPKNTNVDETLAFQTTVLKKLSFWLRETDG